MSDLCPIGRATPCLQLSRFPRAEQSEAAQTFSRKCLGDSPNWRLNAVEKLPWLL